MLTLLVVSIAVFSGALSGPFIFDDLDAIQHNASLRQLWPPTALFEIPDQLPVSGRPLVSLSLAVNWAIGGDDPLGFRLVNVLIHAANACLIFAVLRRLLRGCGFDTGFAGGAAWAVAAVWSVHPLISEAVVYVIQRTELMVSLFALGSVYAAARHFDAHGKGRSWGIAAFAACLCATLCKEVAVAVPPLVLLYDRTFASGSFAAAWARHRSLHAALFATWAVVAWVVLSSPRGVSVGWGLGVSAVDYLATQSQVILWYLRSVFVPTGLSIAHDWPVVAGPGAALPELLGMSALGLAVLFALWKRPALGFAGACFFAILAPSSSIVPVVTEVAAERRMYLPCLAVLVPCVVGARSLLVRVLPSGFPSSAGLVAASVVVVAALATATHRRLQDYRDGIRIWEAAVAVNPAAPTARNNLGAAYDQAGRPRDAEEQFRLAVELDPDDAVARLNLGRLLAMRGEFDAAEEQLLTAGRLDASSSAAPFALGNLASMRGNVDAAIAQFETALARDPGSFAIRYRLAQVLHQAGRVQEAEQQLQRAKEIDPVRFAAMTSGSGGG